MDSKTKQKLAEIDEEIFRARKSYNYVGVLRLMDKRKAILDAEIKSEQTTLFEVIKDYSPEERRKMTLNMITAVVGSDILLSTVIDIEEKFKELGIIEVPVLSNIKKITKELRNVVSTIHNVHNDFLDENYCEVCDSIEEKYSLTLKNYIFNEVQKRGFKKN